MRTRVLPWLLASAAVIVPGVLLAPVPAAADEVCVAPPSEQLVQSTSNTIDRATGGTTDVLPVNPTDLVRQVIGVEDPLRDIDCIAVPGPVPLHPTYIVVLKDQPSNPLAAAASPDLEAASARQAGATIKHVYRAALRGYAAQMSPQTLAVVSADPDVKYIERDVVGGISVTQTNAPWGLDRIDQRNLPLDTTYNYTTTGTGVTAYVIDTGIEPGHAEFGGRAAALYDYAGGTGVDCHGHGTHVAGTIGGTTYGVAKAVSLVGVRILDCGGFGNASDAAAGVDWVTQHHVAGPAVANMSVWFPPSQALDDAVRNSILDGVVYSVSANNWNDDACNYSPSRVTEAMVIGATDDTDTRAWFSNYGPCVDWYAPGVDVESAWLPGPTDTAVLSGTSMATPHNAGAIARYLQVDPAATPATVETFLRGRTTKDIVQNANSTANDDLLYMTAPVNLPAYGHITITKHTAQLSPSFIVTGVYLTDFSCGLFMSPIRVECVPLPNPDVVWECAAFINTATAPAPGDTGAGNVSTRVKCDSGNELTTPDVVGTGVAQANNWAPPLALGSAQIKVICRAAGVNGGADASGSYEADCYEPGVTKPFDTA